MKYYVYEHWRTDTDLCFYVGKGSGNRAYDMHKRWRPHKEVQSELKRTGFAIEVRIVASGLSEARALLGEAERIVFWDEAGVPIVNLQPRNPTSEATRAKMRAIGKKRGFHPNCRIAHKAKLTGRKRAPFTEQHLQRIRAAAILREQRKREKV